ncbi:MAG TPA: bis(5'-nucleosyl)-tetraphosphatase (symmetrical) YqeK [Desulfobacteria bacterium]|nr:bis(5'-nucleosyl)-tetraphosphatase (symmetrical) YqeK [Desulfobacteria bacterium]
MINQQLKEKIKNTLSPYRYSHTVGVVETSLKLAQLYGADQEVVEVSALLHDIAREIDNSSMLSLCPKYDIVPDEIEQHVPELLHGKVGAAIAKESYGIDNTLVLDAIGFHTTGRKGMSLVEKIVFIADMIEPGRDFPGVDLLRQAAFDNLNKSVLAGLNSTIRFVLERSMVIHPLSIEARNHLIMFP